MINEHFFTIQDLEEMLRNIDVNTMQMSFITIVEEAFDKMVPIKIIKEWSYPKWMTR